MARQVKPRDHNRFAQHCQDCQMHVKAGDGFLYRHHGSSMLRGLKRGRYSKFAYVVRCEACAVKHDGPNGRASATVESSGITYTGYGANSHAICGN